MRGDNAPSLYSFGSEEKLEVHVWECCLALDQRSRTRLHAVLSLEEKERVSRFSFERDRSRYATLHGMLRVILGGYLKKEPGGIDFETSAFGKPRMAAGSGESALRFSISRSRDLALVAVAVGMEVGVDIEFMAFDMDFTGIARHCFSAEEYDEIISLPETCRRDAFFRFWTRKEAYLKGVGIGLMTDSPSGSRGTPEWTLFDLPSSPGYSASLAVRSSEARIVRRTWGFQEAPGI